MSPSRSSGCRRRRSLPERIRDWWDLRLRRYDRLFARLDPLGPDEPLTGAGMREPRRPLKPTLSAGAELELTDY